jgi:hypothetical protein
LNYKKDTVMKKAFIYIVLILAIAFTSLGTLSAQPHPGEQSGAGEITEGRIGQGAPVGNGSFILLTLAMAYAGRKMYQGRTAEEEE